MKKLSIGLILLTISIGNLFACHLNKLGQCSDKAYFLTQVFNNGAIFQFREFGDTTVIMEYVTPDVGSTDKIISFDLKGNETGKFQFRWKYKDSTDAYYDDWGNNDNGEFIESSTTDYCSILPVKIYNIAGQESNNKLTVSFSADNENDISYYNIKGSNDGQSFEIIKKVTPNSTHNYISVIDLGISSLFIPFLALIGFEDRKLREFKNRKVLSAMIIFLCVFLYACKKDVSTRQVKNYKQILIESVSKDNNVSNSNVVDIKM